MIRIRKADALLFLALAISVLLAWFGASTLGAADTGGERVPAAGAAFRSGGDGRTEVCVSRTAPMFGDPVCTAWLALTAPAAPAVKPVAVTTTTTPKRAARPARDLPTERTNQLTGRRQVCLYKALSAYTGTYVCVRWRNTPGVRN